MKTWTIKRRILFIVGVLTLLLLVVGGTSIEGLIQARRNADSLRSDSLPGLTACAEMVEYALRAQNFVLMADQASSPDERTRFLAQRAECIAKVDAAMKQYETTLLTEVDRRNFEDLKNKKAIDAQKAERYLALVKADKTIEAEDYLLKEFDPAFTAYRDHLVMLLKSDADSGHATANHSYDSASRTVTIVAIVIVTSLVIGVALSLVMVRSTNSILSRLADSLHEASNQTASAAGQVSASSQTLAEGASEQAASLEETSSSLEEMSSMAKRNAENSHKADEFAKQARIAADKGAGNMESMNAAMEAIKVSSDDIAKIIKTIDEIAFQTNILALNAAVEAARAGEAGMGFGVVADEVRNLAQRSAQAAKETSAKIAGAINNTAQGVTISRQVAGALNDIVAHIRQVDELMAQVASASSDQTQGIGQINTAITQMDKVTQSNAASAEESASAAEELSAQAEATKRSVDELLILVGGKSQAKIGKPVASVFHRQSERSAPSSSSPAPLAPQLTAHHRNGHHSPTPVASKTAAGRSGDIPMDGSFTDF